LSTRVLLAALTAALTFAAAALVPSRATAAPRLNDTGIDFCIDAFGQFIDCHGTGQDATSGRDVSHPRDADGRLGFRFTRLCNSGEQAGEGSCPAMPQPGDAPDEWGCTRDEVTRLLWETKTASGPRSGSLTYTNYSPEYDPDRQYGHPTDLTGFIKSFNEAGLCGSHDWRLPRPTELMGIADMDVTMLPPVDQRFFPNTLPNLYWGAGENFAKDLAWGTSFSHGMGGVGTMPRTDHRGARMVRGGESSGERFSVSPDGQEVSDRLTRLAWRRCVEGKSFDGEHCSGEPLTVNWTKALSRARQQARDTGVAWRLPNVKELASLLDHEHLPRIDTHAFPGAGDDFLWTSSSFPTDPTPRCVDFRDGIDFSCTGWGTFGLRLVRDRD
jgi:hypothetical protein